MGLFNTLGSAALNVINPPAALGKSIGTGLYDLGKWFGGLNNNQNKITTPNPTIGTQSTQQPQGYDNSAWQRELAALMKASAPVDPLRGVPSLNLVDIYNKARQTAESKVNPFYQQQLNNYLEQQNVTRQRYQQDFQTQMKQFDDTLAKTTQENQLQGQRTEEDVARNIGNITTGETMRQKTEGREFDAGLRGLRENLAESGQGFRGLGAQKIADARVARGEAERAKTFQVKNQKETQNIMKNRTLADLARSTDWATKQTGEAKGLAQRDLDRQMEDLIFSEKRERMKIELDRQAAVEGATTSAKQNYYQNYLSGLKSNQQKSGFSQLYGNWFNS